MLVNDWLLRAPVEFITGTNSSVVNFIHLQRLVVCKKLTKVGLDIFIRNFFKVLFVMIHIFGISFQIFTFALVIFGCDAFIEFTTSNAGIIRGNLVTENGHIYSVFLGIPYATPPIGNQRFKVKIINATRKYSKQFSYF